LAENRAGTVAALPSRMTGAYRFEDLVAWQLAEQLKEEVLRLIQRQRVARDEDFCDDIRRSARSAPANIAEGFGWYEPKPNGRHVSIAKASLEETKNHILEGFKRNHFDLDERNNLLQLNKRALIATTRYLRYLKSCKRAPDGKPFNPRQSPNPATPQSEAPSPQSLRNCPTRNSEGRSPELLKPDPKNQEPKNQEPKNQEPRNQEPRNLRNKNLGNLENPGT
jgi:four helix bundle protein